jgi:hypothetical protein
MSRACIGCGAPLPGSHPYRSCSMCFGDLDYGTDGYYRAWLEDSIWLEQEQEDANHS